MNQNIPANNREFIVHFREAVHILLESPGVTAVLALTAAPIVVGAFRWQHITWLFSRPR